MTFPDATTAAFAYDADGNRTQKIDRLGEVSKFVYDVNLPLAQVVLEADGAGSTTASYGRCPMGELISGLCPLTSDLWYYHYDGLGSTTALTDHSQVITDTYSYNAWGNIVSKTGTTNNPYQYVGILGYYADTDTGLMLLGARYYDAGIGRFISRDPILQLFQRQFASEGCIGCGGTYLPINMDDKARRTSQSLHPYVYGENNPVMLVDPLGLVCGAGWTDWVVPDTPNGFDFREACHNHDCCYACGKRSRAECDEAFYKDMLKVCEKVFILRRLTCRADAWIYYKAVRKLGDKFYRIDEEFCRKYCDGSCVEK